MNGSALGGFANGLLSGASLANSAMKASPTKSPDVAVPTSDKPGFGLGQPLMTGEFGSTQYAGDANADGWGSLKKIVGSLGSSSQSKGLMSFTPSGGQ
ncbi:hypothetical protein [Agrobacterium tumefaciens]|uniref:hypothetical protein n=1 Tax=Agrobacterium tumefaciens TaxID=358 RepID=UPI0015742D0C|nr:hypothetical protein [Agrobacterium tumefaciens]